MSGQAAAPAPVRPSVRTGWAAAARQAWWRTVYGTVCGLQVTGTVPTGPAVVVANHASHADTAALLAALPAAHRPVVAAAADYWFAVRWRRLVVASLVAALPVRRRTSSRPVRSVDPGAGADGGVTAAGASGGGGFLALAEAALPHLRAGGTVILYPEGTRSTDGQVGDFRAGAVRLAALAGVPVVPIALLGTAELLPKHGRLTPGPVEVRVGTAREIPPAAAEDRGLAAGLAADLRADVVTLRSRPRTAAPTSRVWRAVAARMSGRAALPAAFCWGVAEALSWPLVAEMWLVVFAAAVPRRVLPAAACLAAGSVVGVAVHAWLAARGVVLPAPLTTPGMRAAAAQHLADGPHGVWRQLANGIPVKVYAAEAGASGLDLTRFLAVVALERPARIVGVGAAVAVLARVLSPWLRRGYGAYLLVVLALFAVSLGSILRSWS